MYEVGEEFYYYGDREDLHGNIGTVLGKERISKIKEYRCKIEGARFTKYLAVWKMRKKTPDWEI